MRTHNICFRGEIRKISAFFRMKKVPCLLLCPYFIEVYFLSSGPL